MTDRSSVHAGGGVGIWTGGVRGQFGEGYAWGQQYGGVSSREQCYGLPDKIQKGCQFRWDFMNGADNPYASYRQIRCPKEISDISGCRRSDDPIGGGGSGGGGGGGPTISGGTSTSGTCDRTSSAQCGGKTYTGEKCCPPGTYCRYVEPYYSRCSSSSSSSGTTGGSCPNKLYSQCGGQGFSGAKCCPSGMYCKYANTYWSDCQKS